MHAHGPYPLRAWTAASLAFVVSAAIVSTLAAQSSIPLPEGDAIYEASVEKTCNNSPFRYQMHKTATKGSYDIYRITYPSPVVTPVVQNNTIPADYYLPHGITADSRPRPAVICIHILNGNFELVRTLCSSLAARGIPAVMFKLPYYGERALPGGELELARSTERFVEAISQGAEDARRTFDLLASRPEIDPERIGISGISLGGIVSASTAGVDPRIDRAALILAGGDLLRVIHHARESEELSRHIRSLPEAQRTTIERAINQADPLTHAAKLRKRAMEGRVLMINATQDNVIPPSATKKLATALGMADRVVWLEGLGHYTAISRIGQIMQQTVDFFAIGMPADALLAASSRADATDPLTMITRVLSQLGSLLAATPEPGHCHQFTIDATVTDPGGKTHQGQLRLALGADHRFRIDLEAPKLGKAVLGQGETPWLASKGTIFLGTPTAAGSGKRADPLSYAKPEWLTWIRMAGTTLSTLHMAPGILEQIVRIEPDGSPKEPYAFRIQSKKENGPDHIRIVFQSDRETPRRLTFQIDQFQGTLEVATWQTGVPEKQGLFQPPAGLPVHEVDSDDLLRIYSAMFNFAMEFVQ